MDILERADRLQLNHNPFFNKEIQTVLSDLKRELDCQGLFINAFKKTRPQLAMNAYGGRDYTISSFVIP